MLKLSLKKVSTKAQSELKQSTLDGDELCRQGNYADATAAYLRGMRLTVLGDSQPEALEPVEQAKTLFVSHLKKERRRKALGTLNMLNSLDPKDFTYRSRALHAAEGIREVGESLLTDQEFAESVAALQLALMLFGSDEQLEKTLATAAQQQLLEQELLAAAALSAGIPLGALGILGGI